MNKIKFNVGELEYVVKFLDSLKLIDYRSRMRTRFVRTLAERLSQYYSERLDLIKEHANLDQNDEPIIIQDGDNKMYDIPDIDAFQKASSSLLDEEFVIEVNDNNKNTIKSVADSILNCGLEFHGQDAYNYNSLCERFESLQWEDGEENEG